MRKISFLVTWLIVGLLLTACAGTKPAPPAPPPASAAIDASKLFATNCAVCHGAKREGISGLGKALTPASLAGLSVAEVKAAISKGRTGTVMAGFESRLSASEIDALVQFIKETTP